MYKSRHVDSVDKYYKGALRELLIYEERLGLISKAKNPVTRKHSYILGGVFDEWNYPFNFLKLQRIFLKILNILRLKGR